MAGQLGAKLPVFAPQLAEFVCLLAEHSHRPAKPEQFAELFFGDALSTVGLGGLIGQAFKIGLELRDLLAQRLVFFAQADLRLTLYHQGCCRPGNDQGGEAEFEMVCSHKVHSNACGSENRTRKFRPKVDAELE